MKTKRVNRYYCDYCKKSGCAKGHIAKHELHCTMNPNRVCRMCVIGGWKQPDTKSLLALLPSPPEYPYEDFFPIMEESIKALRKATNECPACMLAALRQAHFEAGYYVNYFDFGKEANAFINFNRSRDEENWNY